MYKYYNYPQYNDNRFGFAVPFLLGGLTGGVLAPYFNNGAYYNNIPYPNKVYYSNNYYPYYQMPYYSGYIRK